VSKVIEAAAPDEIYNLSGQSSVALSFTQPAETLTGIALGTLNMLETLRRLRGKARFYNAGSSERGSPLSIQPQAAPRNFAACRLIRPNGSTSYGRTPPRGIVTRA